MVCMIVKTTREKELLIKMNWNIESDAECWDLLGPIQTWGKKMGNNYFVALLLV